jgi:hypothetical protein
VGVLVAIALAGAVAHAGPGDPTRKSGWEGLAPGSFVHLRITSSFTDPGVTIAPTTVELKHTLLETTNEGWGVKVETKDSKGERWLVTEPRRFVRAPPDIHHSGAKLETLGTETITIEGVAYECVKRKSVVRTEAFSWTHEKHGVLKSESGGKTMLVTRLSVRLAVAGKELECRETRTSSLGGTVVATALHSAAVPGGVARSQLDSRKDGVGTRQVTEVLAFGTP